MSDADTTPAIVSDHPFQPPTGRPWERCTTCGLAGAAHLAGVLYRPRLPYRCPDCVTADVVPCPHQPAHNSPS
jgi:hypothetical protein